MSIVHGLGIALLAGMAITAPASFAQNGPGAHTGILINPNGSRLGVGGQNVTTERAKALKMKDERGAEITMVSDGSPAAKAGIKPGDVILDFNGKPVPTWEDLRRMVAETQAGSEVKIGLWRNGQYLTLMATTARMTVIETPNGVIDFGGGAMPFPLAPPMPPMPSFSIDIPTIVTMVHSPALGLDEETLQPEGQLGEFFGVREGVLVKSVVHDSPADKAGIKAGDVIVKVGDSKVTSTRDITAALRSAYPDRGLPITLVRNKKEMAISVTLEDRRNARRF